MTLAAEWTAMPPFPARAGADAVAVPRRVLARLVESAKHVEQRTDIVLGNTADRRVRWECTPDCPACAARALLEEPNV